MASMVASRLPQEVTQRVLEAVGGIAGSSLEQTSWLSRSLEVKVQPQICEEADEADDADMDGDQDGNVSSRLHLLHKQDSNEWLLSCVTDLHIKTKRVVSS